MIGRKNRLARVTGVGLTLVMTLALSAGPLLAECTSVDGTPRPCTPSENASKCTAAANDAFSQCMNRAESIWERGSCRIGRAADGIGCTADFLRETVGLEHLLG